MYPCVKIYFKSSLDSEVFLFVDLFSGQHVYSQNSLLISKLVDV